VNRKRSVAAGVTLAGLRRPATLPTAGSKASRVCWSSQILLDLKAIHMYSITMPSTEVLEQEIATLSAHLDAATHRLLECIRQFDKSGGWADQGALSCAHWLAWRVGLDLATAREKVRVARALGTLPAIDEAFRSARLSYAKVRALTRVATPQTEGKLLDIAVVATGAQLERLCRGYRGAMDPETAPTPEERSVYKRVLPGGMVKLELVLQPDEADLVMRAIERAREVQAEQAAKEPAGAAADASAEGSWPSRADGAVELAESFLAGHQVTGNGGERFQVMVHLGQEPLGVDGEWAATLEDGTRVSAEALRRVACDCALLAVGGDGENLNIGRRSRSIPPALRRALMLRDRGCAFPGCTHSSFLHGHHIEHWLHGGATRLDNLAMMCSRHHCMVHEGGWTITTGADGKFLFQSPSGKRLARNPLPEPVDDGVAWMRGWADERELDLGPEVNFPEWDGVKPDYKLAVEGLLAAAHPT
jgi:hypothetical protein